MNDKQLRKVQITNMALWGVAIVLPIVAPAFASEDPKRLSTAAWAEVQRMILEEEPARPSVLVSSLQPDGAQKSSLPVKDKLQLSGLLRGELDWIVLKAIDKDRS